MRTVDLVVAGGGKPHALPPPALSGADGPLVRGERVRVRIVRRLVGVAASAQRERQTARSLGSDSESSTAYSLVRVHVRCCNWSPEVCQKSVTSIVELLAKRVGTVDAFDA